MGLMHAPSIGVAGRLTSVLHAVSEFTQRAKLSYFFTNANLYRWFHSAVIRTHLKWETSFQYPVLSILLELLQFCLY